MKAWVKGYLKSRKEKAIQKKFIWVAEQLELHATGRGGEAFSPIMALAGDVVAMWDDLSEDQKNWLRVCGDELADKYNRPGFRASVKLRDKSQ
ncbi:MAG: hypothetical protein ACRC6V_01035 [Bacteroidales bacterium]